MSIWAVNGDESADYFVGKVVRLTAQLGSPAKFCAETTLPAATIAKSVVLILMVQLEVFSSE